MTGSRVQLTHELNTKHNTKVVSLSYTHESESEQAQSLQSSFSALRFNRHLPSNLPLDLAWLACVLEKTSMKMERFLKNCG